MDAYPLWARHVGGRGEAAASHSRSDDRRVRPENRGIIRGWYSGTCAEISNTKRGHIAQFNVPEFLRNVLFPIHGKIFFTGIYKDRNIMYGWLIDVFNRAIRRLEKEPQVNA